MIKKSALLIEQFQKLVNKNKFEYDIYDNIESLILEKYNEKVFKNQSILYEQFRTKNSGIKNDIWLTMILIYFSLLSRLCKYVYFRSNIF